MDSKTSNPFDDTRRGRLAQATLVAAVTALPDYVGSRLARFVIDTGLIAGAVAISAQANRQDDDPTNDPEAIKARVEAQLGAEGKGFSPAQTWGLFGAGVASLAGSYVLNEKITRALTGWLRRKGVQRPHTLLGAVAFVAAYCTAAPEIAKDARQAAPPDAAAASKAASGTSHAPLRGPEHGSERGSDRDAGRDSGASR